MMDRKGRLVSYRPYLGLFVTDDQGATYQKFTFSPALEKPNYFVVDEEAFINHGIFQFQYSYDAENAPLKAARITL